MVGTTLGDIRQYVRSLASEAGRYYLVCGRTGEQPVPAVGLSFESRPTARAAARATEQYRAALRRYDPGLPTYDVIVCERVGGSPANATSADDAGSSPASSGRAEPVGGRSRSDSAASPGDGSLIDFCHAVAGAMFETIAASPHDDLENAIMDTYFDVAERIEHTDELCLRLLESTAAEVERALEPAEQRDLVVGAAQRLPATPSADDPVESTLSELQAVALLDAYTVRSRTVEAETGARSWTVSIDEYALAEPAANGGEDGGDGIVTLPLSLELLRRYPSRDLRIADVEHADPGSSTYRVTVTTDSTDRSRSLVRASGVSRP